MTEFFGKVTRASKSGNWTDADKVTIAVLKLSSGAAALFLNSNEEATRDDITFSRVREIFVERFRVKHLDQFHYSALQNAVQHRNETPEQFGDWCRRLCARTVRQVADPSQQKIINKTAKRRMLTAYINGLYGSVGRQVRYRMPSTLTEAIQIATTVQEVETLEAKKSNHLPEPGKMSFHGGRVYTVCFNCNKSGHADKDCHWRRSKASTNKFSQYTIGSTYNGNSNRHSTQCIACEKFGHYARDCKSSKKAHQKVQGST